MKLQFDVSVQVKLSPEEFEQLFPGINPTTSEAELKVKDKAQHLVVSGLARSLWSVSRKEAFQQKIAARAKAFKELD